MADALTIMFGQTASAEMAQPDFLQNPPEFRPQLGLGYQNTSKWLGNLEGK